MNRATMGFTYVVEEYDRSGKLVSVTEDKNLIPIEGLNHIIETALKEGTPYPDFYVGLYSGVYTPVPADVMATFLTSATELTAYSQTTRPVLALGTVAAGQVDNVASPAEFTGTVDGTVARGGFVCVAPTKGATTGPLMSAVQFSSPKSLDNGGTLRVRVYFAAASI
jgi:hypothetical protein